jgi:hypothetical protein
MEKAKCLLCGKDDCTKQIDVRFHNYPQFNCARCGSYVVDRASHKDLEESPQKGFKLACLLHERKLRGLSGPYGLFCERWKSTETSIDSHLCGSWRVDDLLKDFPTPVDLFDRALQNLKEMVNHPMARIKRHKEELAYWLFCPAQLVCTQVDCMQHMGLIKDRFISDRGSCSFIIAPKGWERIHELSRVGIDSQQAFVAMHFDSSTDSTWTNGIERGVSDAGYKPKRIDLEHHNNKICDMIIAEIRKSRFVVCDFTYQRGGVYFEAGFAMGLGLPVIWTVHHRDITNLHFDTRQYSHIVYETDEELRKKLRQRIEATIGRGPISNAQGIYVSDSLSRAAASCES